MSSFGLAELTCLMLYLRVYLTLLAGLAVEWLPTE